MSSVRKAMQENDGRIEYADVVRLGGDVPLTQSASPHAKKTPQDNTIHITGSNPSSPGKAARHYAGPEMSGEGWLHTVEAKRNESKGASGKKQKS